MTADRAREVLAHPAQHGGLKSAEVAEAIRTMIAAGELREMPAAKAGAGVGCVREPGGVSAPTTAVAGAPGPRYRATGNLEVGRPLGVESADSHQEQAG